MRAALIVLVLVGRAAADSPPIETAIESAARDKKQLILEFGAVWCAPCVAFERTVLVDPRVVAELGKVSFVRYDVDTPIG
jgi:thiol:disulfide interchange protein